MFAELLFQIDAVKILGRIALARFNPQVFFVQNRLKLHFELLFSSDY